MVLCPKREEESCGSFDGKCLGANRVGDLCVFEGGCYRCWRESSEAEVVGEGLAFLGEGLFEKLDEFGGVDAEALIAGLKVRRSTVEWTSGGGAKAPGGRVNRLSTRA